MCHVCVQRKGEGKKTLSDEESTTFWGGNATPKRVRKAQRSNYFRERRILNSLLANFCSSSSPSVEESAKPSARDYDDE